MGSFGCATPVATKMSFEDALREGRSAPVIEPGAPLQIAFEHFLATAKQVRLACQVGAPMPAGYARAWAALLDDADAFLAKKGDAQWATDAMSVRLQLETEFQTDAHAFGDVPPEIALRAPRTLRALSRRITTLTARARVVDPKRFGWPVDPVVVNSPYGSRVHPIAGEPRFHAGVDLEAARTTPIRAVENGTVVFAAWNGAHGKQVELRHDAHWSTRYSHLDALLVRLNTVVKKGQVIGLSGETGLATGPHLHFELRRDGDALDPEVLMQLPATGPALLSESR